jgi:hypothetical protein
MTRYFIVANSWLVFALITVLGDTPATLDPHGPAMSSFFGKGEAYSSTYTFIEVIMFAASALFFILTWTTRKKS